MRIRLPKITKRRASLLALLACGIAMLSGAIYITNGFIEKMKTEAADLHDRIKIATEALTQDTTNLSTEEKEKVSENIRNYESQRIELCLNIIWNNNFIPVVITNDSGYVTEQRCGDDSPEEIIAYAKEHGDTLHFSLQKHKEQTEEQSTKQTEEFTIYFGESSFDSKAKVLRGLQILMVILFVFAFFLAITKSQSDEIAALWTGFHREADRLLKEPLDGLKALHSRMLQESMTPIAAAEMMSKEVEKIKRLSHRLDRIGRKPDLKFLSLNDTIRKCVETQREHCESISDINFTDSPSPIELPHCPELLSWAVENIVARSLTAIKSEKGNAIPTRGLISITLTECDTTAQIDIADNGRHLSTLKARKISSNDQTIVTGDGEMGLSITKRIVREMHNGEIEALSNKRAEGTTIRITLPKTNKNDVAPSNKA